MATLDNIGIKFVADENIPQTLTPLRTGLRSQAKEINCSSSISADDRRLRYSQEVTLESSSDEEDNIIRPAGEAVLSQTPISSHDVFSFKKIKRRSALAEAASEAIHVKTPQRSRQPKIQKSVLNAQMMSQRELTKTRTKQKSDDKKKKATTTETPRKKIRVKDKRRERFKHKKGSGEETSSSNSETSSDEETERNRTESMARMINSVNYENNNLEEMLDEYFLAHDEKNCLTSDKTLSHLTTPRMDQQTLVNLLKSTVESHLDERCKLYAEYRTRFEKWAFLLRNGFNLLLHGLGSKRCIIDQFRSAMLSKFVQLVVNGYFPSITIKNILNTITNDILEHDGTFKNPIEHCNYIRNYYNENNQEELYLVIHNIDGAMLRSSKTQTILSSLAQSPSIHLIASIDHIHAPLIWDQTQSGKFNWLWYDVTTFEPYSEETSYENSLLVQQSGSLALSSLIHVFRSLTTNAKGVFILIANYQLEHSKEASYNGLSFHECYTKSREAFLVNSDATLRAQLTEFRDHKLLRSKKGSDGVEYLLIPLEDFTLKQFIEDHESNSIG